MKKRFCLIIGSSWPREDDKAAMIFNLVVELSADHRQMDRLYPFSFLLLRLLDVLFIFPPISLSSSEMFILFRKFQNVELFPT